jgi:uncharacterized membrane protein YeaQ/YmgE (transglycosylase-associated protein family)
VSLLAYLILLALTGLIVGAFARLALPGPDPMGIFTTILVGLAGSFIAGFLWTLVSDRGAPGILLSVVCATGIVYLIRRSRGGTLMDPGPGLRRRPPRV